MKFGRDANKFPKTVSSPGGGAGRILFLLLFAGIGLAVAYVMVSPAEKLSHWLNSSREMIRSTENPVSNLPEIDRKVESVVPAHPRPVGLDNLNALDIEKHIFDPVQRSERITFIARASGKDRAINLNLASEQMNTAIEKINTLIAKEYNNRPVTESDRLEQNIRLAEHRESAEQVMQEFNQRANEIDQTIAIETTRRHEILRGLREAN